jgi:cyclin-dependent kinase regulatory subunit CKS1
MPHYPKEIDYSEKYYDDVYEYKHVILPRELFEKIPRDRVLNENEWRALGIAQTKGWVHYTIHKPEPHILLFRRPIGIDPITGMCTPEILEKVYEYEQKRVKITK